MADFKIEVPISVKGDTGGKKTGETIADAVGKKLKSILGTTGTGKMKSGGATSLGIESAGDVVGNMATQTKGTGKMVNGIGKLGGIMAGVGLAVGAIAMVIEALSFIIKPIMSLLKIILMLLFLPLVPILKPVMQGLAAFIKWFAPVMKKVAGYVEKFVNILGSGITWIWENLLKPIWDGLKTAILAGWEMLKNAGVFIWEEIIVPAFGFLKDVGVWIWEQIIKPVFLFWVDMGEKLWNYIKSLFTGTIDVIKVVWEFIKGLFKGGIEVGSTVWDWFKGLFKGTIDVATTVWSWFKGLLPSGDGSSKTVEDAIITPSGVVHTNPNDYIIATKDPGSLGGGKITVNINNPSVRQDTDIKKIANEVSRVLQRQMTGRIS